MVGKPVNPKCGNRHDNSISITVEEVVVGGGFLL